MNEDKATSAVERYARRTTEEIAPGATKTEEPDKREYQAFSTISANRRPELMLDFRFKGGNARALPYAYLVDILWNPTEGIRLNFSGDRTFFLRGRNLHHLQQGLLKHHVAWVQEIDEVRATALPKTATIIDLIEVEGMQHDMPA